ncbi:hypothetical protein [Butyricimonas paravirosa]
MLQINILNSMFVLILLICFSCTPRQEKANDIVNKWLHQEIKFSDSINPPQDSIWQIMLDKEFKLLTIIDTNNCTGCRLKLYEWDRCIKEIDTVNSNVAFLFVVHVKNYSVVDIIKKQNKFTYPIFYDYKNKIGQLNKFPTNPRFQTFLLDKNNKVVLLGNPIGNHRMWKLYKQVLTQANT